jgi:hypothetical protein
MKRDIERFGGEIYKTYRIYKKQIQFVWIFWKMNDGKQFF